MHSEIQTLVNSAPSFQQFLEKTASSEQTAKQFLKNSENSSAASLYMAVRIIYGLDILDWEPESLWFTLERDGFELAEEARNKLQGAITLQRVPSFYWDNLVFQRTVQAFNNEPFDPESLQEPPAAYMAWAVYEAGIIRGLDPEGHEIPEFDEDVQQFIAVCLRREGYIMPPQPLDFVEDNLDKMLVKESSDLKKEVKQAWAKLDKEALIRTEFAENALGIQLAQLAACYLYVQERSENLSGDLLLLR
jgi:hypothetical protein